jgi:hypothetical protein
MWTAFTPAGTDDNGVADDEGPDDPEEFPDDDDEILMVRTFFLITVPDGAPDPDPGRGGAMLLGSRLWEVGETRGRGEERGTEVSEM